MIQSEFYDQPTYMNQMIYSVYSSLDYGEENSGNSLQYGNYSANEENVAAEESLGNNGIHNKKIQVYRHNVCSGQWQFGSLPLCFILTSKGHISNLCVLHLNSHLLCYQ